MNALAAASLLFVASLPAAASRKPSPAAKAKPKAGAERPDAEIWKKLDVMQKEYERIEKGAATHLEALEALRAAYARGDDASDQLESRSEVRSELGTIYDQAEELKSDFRFVQDHVMFKALIVNAPRSLPEPEPSEISSTVSGMLIYEQLFDRIRESNKRILAALAEEEAAYVEHSSKLRQRRKRRLQSASAAGVLSLAAALYAAWRIRRKVY